MEIDVRRLFEIEGEREDFSFSLDLSGTEIWGHKPLSSPVYIEGSAVNRSSIVTLAYKASCNLHTFCDRCLVEFDKPLSFSFEYTLVRELQDSEIQEYILVEGDFFDLGALCESDIVLNLPLKFLCRDDCKGLCPVCGNNLNHSECDCLNTQIDPRLAALKNLLKKD
ncbi:MAG: DUF177 domain-containing protein [Oscillospiraceae bacterium]|nr:DUF177 domain-containing protein [Oscillospiraceae bacterium]